ncbi:tRNA-uridine aminocarboxypropyltransferase [Marinobacter arenosus]|uniref:tRNA-uridine aminocarboxypropyltransferase n=1 Tax=Marinobacter arenosus TaxID=2856822 RepID=UPI001C4C8036|nr:tRNA-uridine aminocarboxypropyltransferase [Marinobacter arenosus]MBW0148409.1 DTW domain-containing protein [Marinobacter arenosus]
MPRHLCRRCHLHPNICVCDHCSAVPNQTPLTVLQHPSEVGRSKGTLRILEQCLTRLQVFVGETPAEFRQAGLGDNFPLAGTAVLFPGADSQALEEADLQGIHHWVLLDGTWRKAAKLLHLNRRIGELPRYHFAAPPPSRYVIRKAPGDHHLATAEAAGHLLQHLEPGLDTGPIHAAMAALVARQLAQIPAPLRERYR